ncbi:hypothetical protein LSM04_007647 [Trypanosoma melophagium]|uniref:uncharacterized protein n=1 Tax=Trypanosoma melophagium TaxID=715481 RepID=UPI00351AA177|nr:hypothetical protein LSM04_007647 [Trypanosoma melophagium]
MSELPVNTEALTALGVLYRRLDPSEVLFNNPDKLDAEIAALKQELGYAGHDIVCISPEKHPEGPAAFAKQLQSFFTEQIKDDEVRLILRGRITLMCEMLMRRGREYMLKWGILFFCLPEFRIDLHWITHNTQRHCDCLKSTQSG